MESPDDLTNPNTDDTANATRNNDIYPEVTVESDLRDPLNGPSDQPSAAAAITTDQIIQAGPPTASSQIPSSDILSPSINPEATPDFKKWNWGAFWLSWIWGIGNSVWLALIGLVPALSLIVSIYLGIKGTELAWKSKQWPSAEAFVAAQKKWAIWGWVLFAITVVATILWLTLATNLLLDSGKAKSNDARRKSDLRSLVTALRLYQYDHTDACPASLTSLSPDYIKVVPKDPKGTSYTYKKAGTNCIVSAALENKADADLDSDANPANGNIYDMSTAK